jgi:hypothetical protein
VEIYASARKHGIGDDDILHAVDQALVAGEQEDGKVLYIGPDRAGISSRWSPSPETTGPRSSSTR